MRGASARVLAGFGLGLLWPVLGGLAAADTSHSGSPAADPRPTESAPVISFTLPGDEPDRSEATAPGSPEPGPVEPFQLGIPRVEDPGADAEPLEDSPFPLPRREDWEALSRRLSFAMAAGSIDQLAQLEPELKAALSALDAIPGHVEYAEWLRARQSDVEVAALITRRSAAAEVASPLSSAGSERIPLYDVWLEWMKDRPAPPRAQDLVPQLKSIFVAAQLPPALVWIAETESSFNPRARSPAGARGLFQLMPGTARELGLKVGATDERLDPVRNAQSAARYLAQLRETFGNWPLALAAYNAGPTRISRLLDERAADSFAEIADGLPVETQLYVPKVLATVTVREGVSPSALAMVDSQVSAAAATAGRQE